MVSSGKSVEKARAAYDPYHGYKQTTKFVKDLKRKLDDAWADYNQAVKWMNLEADLEKARIELDQAKKEYDNLGSSGSTDSSAARAKFAVAEANLASARAALQNAELVAPFAGTITGVNIKSGESVSPTSPYLPLPIFQVGL